MTISLIFCSCMVFILVFCVLLLLTAYRRLKKHYEDLQESHQRLEFLNSELRTQRHDYLNHLQVVYGLMELEEFDELHSYLEPVYKDMLKTGKALKTSKPAINALLKAKMGEAESQGIDFYIEVKSDLKNLHVEDWEVCKVLSNLIDNAITALEKKDGEKKIILDITEDPNRYQFRISNNGPEIPEHMREAIFRQGITSKNGEGHGMGLYIVMNVIKAYQGMMSLISAEEETTFEFSFPKKKEGEG
ncbi:MAG: sensor histidine kinase [Lachnospiraceae bacterium]